VTPEKMQSRIEALQHECNNWEKKYLKVTTEMYSDIQKLRVERDTLKEQIVGLEELNRGLDFCAGESDRKAKDVEAMVKQLTDLCNRCDCCRFSSAGELCEQKPNFDPYTGLCSAFMPRLKEASP